MFEFRPLDVGISIVEVAESSGAELEVKEDESGKDEHTACDRDTDDETGAGSTRVAAGGGIAGGGGSGSDGGGCGLDCGGEGCGETGRGSQ